MSTNMAAFFPCLLFLLRMAGASDIRAGCGKVSAVFQMDWTGNVNEEGRHQMLFLAKHIASSLPPGSTANFSLVADRNIHLKTPDSVPLDVSNSNEITASAIEAGIREAFSTGRVKVKAEIVYLFVGELTPIEIPPILLKKKTFVTVIGSSIPTSLRRIASSDGHIYLVRNIGDIATVEEAIRNQTCQDSQYVCDVDEYKENRRYSSCKDCLYVCSQRRIEVTDCPVCPYMRLPPKTQEVMSRRREDEHVPVRYIKDNKSSAFIAVALSFIAICVVTGVLTSVLICHRRNVACFSQELEGQVVELRGQSIIPESNAIAEVGQEAAAGDHDIPLLPRPRSNSESHNGGEDTAVVEGQDYINLRHSHSQCGVEETSL